MKTFVAIVGGVCLLLFAWAFWGWGGRVSSFDQPVSAETIKQLLASRDLAVCDETVLQLNDTPGFVEGKSVTVSRDCALDKNPMRVSMLRFDSAESRNAAKQRVASTHRGGYGPHLAYSYGPYVITVQGTRGIGDQVLLGQIMTEAGANH